MVFAGATDNGKVRSKNEDSFYAFYRGDTLFAIVADGMGGHNAGEVASNEAIRAFEESVMNSKSASVSELLTEAIQFANRRIFAMTVESPSLSGMGTTVTACAVCGNHAVFANVGDSRGYVVERDVTQITKDHSLVAELLAAGDITEEEAKTHPQKNLITRAVGTTPTIIVDLFEIDLSSDSMILLCSDGLSNVVSECKIFDIFRTETQLERIVSKLIAEANEMGGHDNITALVIATRGQEEKNHE